MRQKILVTGSNGQLGQELQRLTESYPQFEFLFLPKDELPVDHEDRLRHYFKTFRPDYLINCAAYTAVDKAEEEREKAFLINGDAVGLLAKICKEQLTRLVHISTDYVFDGTAGRPYLETDTVDPQNVYGASKLEGEKQLFENNSNSIVVRSSWVYSEFGKNFVKTMLRLMQERDSIQVVNDQLGSPTYAADLATAILQIVSSSNWQPGIYNYCNEGIISWYDFAVAIKEISNSDCEVIPIRTSSYPTPAKRPAWSALDTQKIRETFAIVVNDWKSSLEICLRRLSDAQKNTV